MKSVKNTIDFTVDQLINHIKENNIKTCGIVSTINKKSLIVDFLKTVCENINSKNGTASVVLWNEEKEISADITFVYCDEILEDYKSLCALKKCDSVIFVEKYGITKHKKLDEAKDILNIQGITPYGVIALK